MIPISEDQFHALASRGYNRIPVALASFADLDTPLSLYLKLANRPFSFLLESVVGGERFGRYSFIGLPAATRIRVRGDEIEVETAGKVGERVDVASYGGDPIRYIEAFLERWRVAPVEGLPRFPGGLAGYFGYDTIRYFEKKLARVRKPDALGVPDILLLLAEELAVVDNVAGKIWLIVHADPAVPGAYRNALERLHALRRKLRQPAPIPYQHASKVTAPAFEFARDDYLAAVARAKEYIYAGDVMQVQIGQRMRLPFTDSPLSFYRALRSVNPSPYMFYYDFGDFHVVGASPEILVRNERRETHSQVHLRPIAGTRPRGATPEDDQRLAAELLADPKEIAEHVMLIDLARNDVGRIAEIGSVKVIEQMVIERYSHVMHIVSDVEGRLKKGLGNADVLRATFPAGTLTGAPKIRAMEIIDELEPSKRGIYGGAVGYLGFSGEMDLAIAIRTAIIKEGTLYAQAAAGIVADSDPVKEWEETLHKTRSLIRAAELVQRGLDEQED
jgi:anthranilate synthase component 1